MKKVLHRDFYYQIPEKSGFTLIETQGKPRVIFVNQIEFDNPDLHSFLLKILLALHLEVGNDLEIIPCHLDNTYPIHTLMARKNMDFISFGIRPSQLHLQGFEVLHKEYLLNGNRFFFADSLKAYTNEASKKLLWIPLKKMFGI